MTRKLSDSVVVITGAASGIGLATAYACSNRGAFLVLAGRRPDAIEAVAAECREWGGRAIAVPTDVAEEDQVRRLAQQAIETFGRIDIWVNNAAVTAFGRIDELPTRIFRRVIETNLYGYLYGIKAALPLMREQGGGIVINVASGVVDVPQPFTSAYVTSKYAIQALSECTRMELLLDRERDLHICTVYPAAIDTPLFQRGANYTGRAVRPMSPVWEPEQVAEAIVDLAEHPRRETSVGVPRKTVALLRLAAPGIFERRAAERVERRHFRDRAVGPSDGNLFGPISRNPELRGGWGGRPHGVPDSGRMVLMVAGAALALWCGRRAAAHLSGQR